MKLFKIALLGLLISVTKVQAQVPGHHFQKVMYVIFENTDFDPTMQQSYFSNFASRGVLFTNFFAETHPSQGNYVAMISGSSFGIRSDSTMTINQLSIIDLLEAKGVSWKVYLEAYPGNCFTGDSGKYKRKHNPFISNQNIQSNPERCSHLADASELTTDIANNQVPQYSFYVPDMDDDGHDTDVATASAWFESTFSPILSHPNFMNGMLLIATFDEGGIFGSNHIYTAMLGDSVVAGSTSGTQYDHTSLIRMIEDNFNLGSLNQGDATSSPVEGFWK